MSPSGTLWVVSESGNGNGNLYRYKNGTWSEQIAKASGSGVVPVSAVADPSNSENVYVLNGDGCLHFSSTADDVSPSWQFSVSGFCANNTDYVIQSSVIPWMTWANDNYLTGSTIGIDPTQAGKLYVGDGTGVHTTATPSGAPAKITWNGNETVGIENLDLVVASAPSGGGVFYAAQDRPLWIALNNIVYPSRYYPNNASNVVNPNQAVCQYSSTMAAPTGGGMTISTDSGATWSAYIGGGSGGLPAGFKYGGCAVQGSGTVVWLDGSVGSPTYEGNGPYITTDAGVSWAACTFSGATAAGGGWVPSSLVVDVNNPSTILIINNGSGMVNGSGAKGVWESTSGCAFSQVSSSYGNAANIGLSVPGYACNFVFWSQGYPVTRYTARSSAIYIEKNCGSTYTSDSTPIAHINGIEVVTLGVAAPGSDGYPSIECICFATFTSLPPTPCIVNTACFGMYEIQNADTGSPTILKIGDGIPLGNLDLVTFMVGDRQIYRKLWGGFYGSGGFVFNYLLNRDLNPATNDNSPAFLAHAA